MRGCSDQFRFGDRAVPAPPAVPRLPLGVAVLAVAPGPWDQDMWAHVVAILVRGGAAVCFVVRALWEGGGPASIEMPRSHTSELLLAYLLAVKNHFP